jgi:putative flippase GtrA
MDESLNSKEWFSIKFSDERVKYVLVGAVNTAFGILLFTLLYFLLFEKIHYILIFVITQIIAVTFSHFMQRNYVWHSKKNYSKELGKFGTTYLVASIANILLLTVAVEYLEISPLYSQYAIGFALIVATYFFQKNWVFRKTS